MKNDFTRTMLRCRDLIAQDSFSSRSLLLLIGCFPILLHFISPQTCSVGFNLGEYLGRKNTLIFERLLRTKSLTYLELWKLALSTLRQAQGTATSTIGYSMSLNNCLRNSTYTSEFIFLSFIKYFSFPSALTADNTL